MTSLYRHTFIFVFMAIIVGCSGAERDPVDMEANDVSVHLADVGDRDAQIIADGESGDVGESDDVGLPSVPGSVPERFQFCEHGASGEVIRATPADYKAKLGSMLAGDTLQLEGGTYSDGLAIFNMNGAEGSCFTIRGPSEGAKAVFVGKSGRNTVSIKDSSYVVLRNLELDGKKFEVDAVKAEAPGQSAHHIVLDGLYIHDHDADRNTVGISTKSPAWRWVIRNCRIESTGTGLYLGNSPGDKPFIDGLIEHNVVVDTLGYNMQIKHQDARPELEGIPQSGTTIIRHNVFSKTNNADTASSRPNVLIGHFPGSGPGADDQYLIYGNFFLDNPTEALFQGEGNIAFYNNVMINPTETAVRIQPHNDVPKRIHIFFNTIIAGDRGARITGGDSSFDKIFAGNAVFAPRPLDGGEQRDNVMGAVEAAGDFLTSPTGALGSGLDLHPNGDALEGAVDTSGLDGFLDWNRDFDGRLREGTGRGAYAGPARADSWRLDRLRKP